MNMDPRIERIENAASFVEEQLSGLRPEVGIILGSGLGRLVDDIEVKKTIPYRDIPGFPVSTALLQKAWREDPSALPLHDLLDMATVNGARALGIDSGAIEVGKAADIQIIDTDSTFFLSPGPFLANFIYSAHSDCISSVIAGGKFVMRDRKVEGEEDILSQARMVLDKIK